MPRIVEQNWDYTKHAEYYSYRPNYANEAIDMLHTLAIKWGGGGPFTSRDSSSRYRCRYW